MGPRGFRRGRRRGLIIGAAVGSAAARRNSDQQVPSANQSSPDDQITELERLGQLRDSGVLTETEFQEKKDQIIKSDW